jgi:hypothetical protein
VTRNATVRRRHFRRLAAAAAVLTGCCVLLAGILAAQGASASAATARAWGVAERIPHLDAIAAALGSQGIDGNANGGVDFSAVSCTKPGYCTAGGDLYSGSDNYGDLQEGWVATESAGVWAAPKVINFHEGSLAYVYVNSISCASPGNCAVVGYYSTATYAGYPETYETFYINEVNGTWSAPKQIPGTSALNHDRWAAATSVSCSAPGDCGVAGVVDDTTEFVASETNGSWGTAQLVPGFRSEKLSVEDYFPAAPVISCPKTGDCTVAGNDLSPTGTQATFVAAESKGTWGSAVPLPGFARGGAVTALSCKAVGDCSAGGWASSYRHQVPFVASETGGTWTSSAVAGFDHLSPAAVHTGRISALSCASPGNCSAGGTYQPSAGETSVLFVSEVGGKWQAAKPAPGVAKTERGISLAAISCPAAGDCGAVITRGTTGYGGISPATGYVLLQTGGTWAPARPVAGTTGTGGATAVSCPAAGVCVAGGHDHSDTEAWVLTRSAQATTLTTAALSAAKAAYGSEGAEKITATVTATTPTPAGQVTVSANGKSLCTITLRNGTGSCRLTAAQLAKGTYKVTARYHGAAPYAASTSAAKTFKVTS